MTSRMRKIKSSTGLGESEVPGIRLIHRGTRLFELLNRVVRKTSTGR